MPGEDGILYSITVSVTGDRLRKEMASSCSVNKSCKHLESWSLGVTRYR